MNNDEMNKTMEFIVEQQAKFAADIEIMREVQAADNKLLKDSMLGLVDVVGSLAGAQTRTEERVTVLAEGFSRLALAQERTETSLNILVNVVERHISGNRGADNRA